MNWKVMALAGTLVAVGAAFLLWRPAGNVAEILIEGDEKSLIERPPGAPDHSASHPKMLLVLLDGVGRDVLYEELRAGRLPELAQLLGARNGAFPHAYLSDDLLSTFPSTTMVAWATALTGVAMPVHGVAGNEFFDRTTATYLSPAPVSTGGVDQTVANYTDGYLNGQVRAPTLYEALRSNDPDVAIWVAMHPLFSGADKLITTSRGALVSALRAFIQVEVGRESGRELYETLDAETVDEVLDVLDDATGPPDVLSVYLAGADLDAHHSRLAPRRAVTTYLREVTSPVLGKLHRALSRRPGWESAYVVITSDHGHTQVPHDERHALGTDTEADDPPALLTRAGFRVRPFELELDHTRFDAVLAYQGAVAYVYLADRSRCDGDDGCDWDVPPRYEEDVLAAAEALHRNNLDGSLAPAMQGALDLILVRRPGESFRVYTGDGKTESVGDHVAAHPRERYVRFRERLVALSEGGLGDRAGDILLVARNGNETEASARYYFAGPYRSWHGSPSRQDSEVPFIVAHPGSSTAQLRAIVDRGLRVGKGDLRAVFHVITSLAAGDR